MPNGKAGDHVELPGRPHVPGPQLIADIAAGRHVIPYFAEDVVREILSFAEPHEIAELAAVLESLHNAPPEKYRPVELVRAAKELRDRFRAARNP